MNSKKNILIVLALMLAACLSVAALAESTTDSAAEGAAKSALEEAQAAADAAKAEAEAAQTESTALNEALEAYVKAKSENRRLELLTSLKEELDSYVAAGTLTQEQSDLILKYYAEQLTLQQNGSGFGRNGRGGRGGKMPGQGMNPGAGTDDQSNGFGGRHGRFGSTMPGQQQSQAPEAPAEQDAGET